MSFALYTIHVECMCDASYVTWKYRQYRICHVIFMRKYKTLQYVNMLGARTIVEPHFKILIETENHVERQMKKKPNPKCLLHIYYKIFNMDSKNFDWIITLIRRKKIHYFPFEFWMVIICKTLSVLHPKMLCAKFNNLNWLSCSNEEDF